jgi:hypothetical protein
MRIRRAVLAATAVAVAASVAVAVASIPSSSGTINGCYDPASGALKPLTVVDDPADCKDPNVLLPFNQTGPQGAPGAAGARGTIGGSHRVQAAVTQTTPPDGEFYTGSVSCPAGQVLLGGGFDADRLAGTFNVITSRPNADATGWDVKLKLTFPFGGTADFAGVFGGLLDRWREENERARAALAHSGIQGLLDAFRAHGPGGAKPTTKEVEKVRKAVGKAMVQSNSSKRAGTRLSAALKDLETPPQPPTQPATAAGEGVYALCGA